jgi:hypothetical protein
VPDETVTITLRNTPENAELLRKIWWLMDDMERACPASTWLLLYHSIGLDTVAKRDEVRIRYQDGIKPLGSEDA